MFDLRAEWKKWLDCADQYLPDSHLNLWHFSEMCVGGSDQQLNWICHPGTIYPGSHNQEDRGCATFDVHTLSRTQTDRYTPTKWLRGDIALPHRGDKCGHIRNWIFVLNLRPGLGCYCCDIWRVMEISYQSKSSFALLKTTWDQKNTQALQQTILRHYVSLKVTVSI